MKLVIVIVGTAELDEVLRRLNARGYRATVIDHSGGFLRQGNVTLFIGVQDALVGDVHRLLAEACRTRTSLVNPASPLVEPGQFFVPRPVETVQGGAVSFVLGIERYERIA